MKKLYKFDPNTGEYIGEVEAELDEWQTEIAGRPCYKGIANAVWDAPPVAEGKTAYITFNGWELRDNPTPAEIQAELTKAVQAYMDAKVQERGYDGILSACSYVNTGIERFDNEGAACRAWRSAVWNKCYAMLAEVQAGPRAVPTVEELISELPKLEWDAWI